MKNTPHSEPLRLADLPCDSFEEALLPIIRRLVRTLQTNDAAGYCRANDRAVEQWGDPMGLSIAHLLRKLVSELAKCRGSPLECFYPKDRAELHYISHDEYNLLTMLYHMRRNETAYVHYLTEELTHGKVGSKAVKAGWTFAKRYSAGAISSENHGSSNAKLRVVRQ
ncbi:MAG: hypothetical protein AAFQ58_07480 [Pseudomonadota bacterium]